MTCRTVSLNLLLRNALNKTISGLSASFLHQTAMPLVVTAGQMRTKKSKNEKRSEFMKIDGLDKTRGL